MLVLAPNVQVSISKRGCEGAGSRTPGDRLPSASMARSWFTRGRKAADVFETTENARQLADQSVAEYRAYGFQLFRQLLAGAGGAAFAYAAMRLMSVMSESFARKTPDSIRIQMPPVPAGVALGGYAVLATLVVALLVAVWAPRDQTLSVVREVARKQFLTSFADVLVPASLLMGLYLAFQRSDAPHTLDLVRFFGPLLVSLAIALFAAAAGTAANPEYSTQELHDAWRRRKRTVLEQGLNACNQDTRDPSRTRFVRNGIALLAVPSMLAGALKLVMFGPDLGRAVGAGFVALVLAAGIYFLTTKLLHYSTTQNWVALIGVTVLATPFAALVSLTYVNVGFYLAGKDHQVGVFARLLLYYFLVLAVAVFLAVRSVTPRAGKPRGVLRHAVALQIRADLHRLNGAPTDPTHSPKLSALTVASAWLTIIPPMGLILGYIAQLQLARNQAATGARREQTVLRRVIQINWTLIVLFLLAMFVLVVTNPVKG